jgi:cysteine desulfurase/selenocysteine lyase
MEVENIFENEVRRRHEFPVAEKSVFLANAQVCPLPRHVATAISDYSLEATLGNQENCITETLIAETRQLAARLLGRSTSEIAIVGATSIGLSMIANGLPFQAGDNVVFCRDDYPSNAVVWMNLKRRCVELREVRPRALGVITLDMLRPLVDSRTRLVALTSTHFISGYNLDLYAVGAWLKELGVLLAIDGIQTIGAVPISMDYVDFLACDSYKWLLGPCASGILFVSSSAQAQLEPTLIGWRNVICPNFVVPNELRFKERAEKYEAGSYNNFGLIGLNASLKLFEHVGHGRIFERVMAHTRDLRERLRDKGYELACCDDERLSGITSFRRKDLDMEKVFKHLENSGIIASFRVSSDGRQWVRFSPHFYNTKEEIDFALDHLS